MPADADLGSVQYKAHKIGCSHILGLGQNEIMNGN